MMTKTLLPVWLLSHVAIIQLSAQTSDNNAVARIDYTISYIITLRPGVTMNQYRDFLINKYIPEYDKNFPGSRMTVSGSDWEGRNQYSATFSFESLKVRDEYFPNATGLTDNAKAAWQKMKPVSMEKSKYILESKRVKADWTKCLNEVTVKYKSH